MYVTFFFFMSDLTRAFDVKNNNKIITLGFDNELDTFIGHQNCEINTLKKKTYIKSMLDC